MPQTMDQLDKLVIEEFIPFRNRLTGVFRDKYPYIFSLAEAVMGRKESKIGLQVTEDGRVSGEYTLYLIGVNIEKAERGRLESVISLPVAGVIKPYIVVERAGLERILNDERAVLADPLAAIARYLPEMTIKFLR